MRRLLVKDTTRLMEGQQLRKAVLCRTSRHKQENKEERMNAAAASFDLLEPVRIYVGLSVALAKNPERH